MSISYSRCIWHCALTGCERILCFGSETWFWNSCASRTIFVDGVNLPDESLEQGRSALH